MLCVCKYFIHYAHIYHCLSSQGFNIRAVCVMSLLLLSVGICELDSVLPVYLASNVLTYMIQGEGREGGREAASERLLIQRADSTHIFFLIPYTSHLYSFGKIITFDMFYVHTILN